MAETQNSAGGVVGPAESDDDASTKTYELPYDLLSIAAGSQLIKSLWPTQQRSINTLLFDWDGTVVDSAQLGLTAFEQSFAARALLLIRRLSRSLLAKLVFRLRSDGPAEREVATR